MVDLELHFTLPQKEFLRRYADGQRFTMKELDTIPRKFWKEDGLGLNMKAIEEKIKEDEIIAIWYFTGGL